MNFVEPLVIFQKAFWGVPLGSEYTELHNSIIPSDKFGVDFHTVPDSMEIDTELATQLIPA
jgi:hypothetical protein